MQERLTAQIAKALDVALTEDASKPSRYQQRPVGIGVVLQCRHTCMESRGIRTPGIVTTTNAMKGALRVDPAARAEFLRMVPAP